MDVLTFLGDDHDEARLVFTKLDECVRSGTHASART